MHIQIKMKDHENNIEEFKIRKQAKIQKEKQLELQMGYDDIILPQK